MTMTIMKTCFRAVLSACVGLLLMMGTCQADAGSAGKEFYLSFPPNLNNTGVLSLFITGQRDTTGTVDIAALNFHATFTVQANKVTTVPIPAGAQLMGVNTITKRGIHVVAAEEVTVYGLNQGPYTTDAYLGLPVDALGLEYYALTYNGSVNKSQVAITGAFDQTGVTITPKSALIGHPAGVPFTITLNRGETYMIAVAGEVTGTRIVATAPVSVVAGVESAHVPNGYAYLDHIVEMLPPVSSWGKSFLTVPVAGRLKGDFFRVIAAENGTKVKINGTVVATLDAGSFYETNLMTRSQVETSAPALLSQFSPAATWDNVDADPMQMLIAPTEQFLSQYSFSTPTTSFTSNFVNVVVPSGEIASLRLDGNPVDSSKFSAIGTSGFSGGQLPLTVGSHFMTSAGNVPFGIYIYGRRSYEAYGYPGGMSFRAINPVGDNYLPNLRLVEAGDTFQGSASDSEDLNANGILDAGEDGNGNGVIDRRNEDLNGNGKLDAGEDINGNGILERDTGILKVLLLPGAVNLKVDAPPFVPGALSVQFSVSRVDLTKPGIGSVQVEDGAGNKAGAPIDIGSVPVLKAVRVVATLPLAGIGIDMASFRKAPYGITAEGDRQLVEWRFDEFKADSAADLGFDIFLKRPTGGERRVVAHELDLYYNDAGGKPVHVALGARTVDVHKFNFVITPSTDKASYVAGETVAIATAVSNLSSVAGPFGVRLSVRDGANAQVAILGTLANQVIAAGAVASYRGLDMPTANVQPGSYTVLAELLDVNGSVAATGSAPFAIGASSGAALKASISTDKQLYGPQESVAISARLNNLRQNEALDDLRAMTTVRNADQSVRMTRTETVAQLGAGAVREFRYLMPLAFAAPGQQTATLQVTRADGTQLDQASTTFTVSSSADTGAGLIGTISLPSPFINAGQAVALSFTASNTGNAHFAGVPLTVSIIDPEKQLAVAEFPYNAALPIGATYNGAASWTAGGDKGATYLAVLSADAGGNRQALAQARFTVFKLDIAQSLAASSRVLALVSCADGQGATADAESKSIACAAARSATIGAALDELGLAHLVTDDGAVFKRALRSGVYNTYWLSGKQDKLHDTVPGELREAVYGGDALIVDGAHDERNKLLDAVSGVIYRGKFGETSLPVTLAAPLFETATLPTAGPALKLVLDGGLQRASLQAAAPDANAPAVVTNVYGSGRSGLFAFDLANSLQSSELWLPALAASLKHVMPAPVGTLVPGAPVSFRTTVRNLGQGTDVHLASTLPAGSVLLAASPAPTGDSSANPVEWDFKLERDQTGEVLATVSAPPAGGQFKVMTAVSTVNDGANPYGEALALPLTVRTAEQAALQVGTILKAYLPASQQDARVRDAVQAKVREATAALAQGDAAGAERAIALLVDAAAELATLPGTGAASARLGIAGMLKDIQSRWTHIATE